MVKPTGLDPRKPHSSIISKEYFLSDINNPCEFLATSIPRKYLRGPKIIIQIIITSEH